MNISINTVPHKAQRYDTVGDWYWDDDGGLIIKVSKLEDEKMEFLVGLHELLEAFLCKYSGISAAIVDEWDMKFEKDRVPGDTSEPGDDEFCPYQRQHQIATIIETLAAHFLRVNMQEFQRRIDKL